MTRYYKECEICKDDMQRAYCSYCEKPLIEVSQHAETTISSEDRAIITKFLARMLGGAKRCGHPGDEYYATQSALLIEERSELNALINRLQKSMLE